MYCSFQNVLFVPEGSAAMKTQRKYQNGNVAIKIVSVSVDF